MPTAAALFGSIRSTVRAVDVDAARIRAAHTVMRAAQAVAPSSIAATANDKRDGSVLGHVLAVGGNEYRAGSALVVATEGAIAELFPRGVRDDEDDEL